MTEQWSDRSAMLNHKTLPPSGPLSYLQASELKTWTSYWKREGSAGMDMWNAPTVQSLTYRLMEGVGLGGPICLGSSWQRGIAESGSSQLSTLMIETPGDLVWDLPCVQQASCLDMAPIPLLWIWLLYLHVHQKSDDDDDDTGIWPWLIYVTVGVKIVELLPPHTHFWHKNSRVAPPPLPPPPVSIPIHLSTVY